MNLKQSRIKCVRSWLNKLRASTAGEYQLNKLSFDVEAMIAHGFTTKQLEAVTGLIAASYNVGHDECRTQFREMKQDRFNPPVFARRSQFKVIQGGAA